MKLLHLLEVPVNINNNNNNNNNPICKAPECQKTSVALSECMSEYVCSCV